jgi:hypothetical protein
MVKGLSQTSEVIAIGFSIDESAPNTFTQERIDLQLNPLDNEVFVVSAINLDPSFPEAIAGTDTRIKATLTTTTRLTMPNVGDSACLAQSLNQISAAGFVDGGVSFQQTSMDAPPAMLEYLGIIATNDFFIQVQGANNTLPGGVNGKMYGYRAKASAATYAALVQSEVLSA